MHVAVENTADPAVVETLLAAGADVNARDADGESTVGKAVSRADLPVVEALLAYGAEVADQSTLLHEAVSRGPELVEALIAAGADLEGRAQPVFDLAGRPGGETPLHYAVGLRDTRVLALLLDAGADVNARNSMGATPLLQAGREEQLAMLLAAGADPNVRTMRGSTALHETYHLGPSAIERLVAAGADVNARNSQLQTPLHFFAQRHDSAEVTRLLLAAGADANATDDEDRTPLHWAASDQENMAVFELLLEAGADVNAQDAEGMTPLYVAAEKNPARGVFEMLIAAGAAMDVMASGVDGLLAAAASNEHPAVVETLLAAGADANAGLFSAARYSGWIDYERWWGISRPVYAEYLNPAVIEVLLAAGANVDARGPTGSTPLHMSVLNRNPAVVEALLAAGADMGARDENGRTPADYGTNVPQIREFLRAAPPPPGSPAASVQEVAGFRDCPTCPELALIPAGSFRMGCQGSGGLFGGDCRHDIQLPVHEVDVGTFALSKYEVTRGQFAAFAASTGHEVLGGCVGSQTGSWRDQSWQSDDHPLVCVSWDDAQAYVRWLSSETGREYRLPSEAEWEYAGRAGTTTYWSWGNGDGDRCGYANGRGDNGCNDAWERTAPVGSFGANGFGLHDMAGNVWEWVSDCWHESYEGAPRDGSAWTRGGDCGRRGLRGGSWLSSDGLLSMAIRHGSRTGYRSLNRGFRVARVVR